LNVKKEYIFITALIIVAGALFGFGSRAGLALQHAIRGASLGTAPDEAELSASIGDAFRGNAAAASSMPAGKTVPVYSQYPLNLKNEFSIAAGSADGIVAGNVALAHGFLVGVVEKTFEYSSIVQTVFDSRFQLPVRIGAAGADALLRGGNEPALTLIAANAAVSEGDEVYSAGSGMPYGVPLGALRSLHDASDKVFREASLAVPYNPGNIEQLTILPSSGQ